jgi:hypothetical protein
MVQIDANGPAVLWDEAMMLESEKKTVRDSDCAFLHAAHPIASAATKRRESLT